MWEGRQLVTGWNCIAQSAYTEMQLTKEQFHKTDGRQYYHFVQSFGEQDGLMPQELHAMGLELAKREFPDFEVLVATHVDTAHPHNYLVVNSVSFQDGRKLHQSAADLQAHRLASDEICIAHGLEILPPPQRRVRQKRMGTREYRSAAKGQSWKFRLMNTIDQCMRYAETREEFISLMESEGYQVRWTDSRKNITYTTPEGMKCRDDRLHKEKYRKEVMEYEFRIRTEIIHGRTAAAESATVPRAAYHPGSAVPSSAEDEARLGGSADRRQRPVPPGADQQRQAGTSGDQRFGTGGPAAGVDPAGGAAPHPGPAGGTDPGCGPNSGDTATGWEEARDLYFAAQSGDSPFRADLADPDFAGDYGWDGGLADDLVRLGRTLERSSDPDPVRDATTISHYTDRKALRREREKKIALGHKVDDHEEEQIWEQKM